MVSFARHGRRKPQSFPRKRESTWRTFRDALSTDWIPAFAGMTGVSKGTTSQTTLPPISIELLSGLKGWIICAVRPKTIKFKRRSAMSANSEASTGNAYKRLLYGIMFFLAVLVIARFVLEVTGTPATVTRYLSSTAGLVLAAIYLAAIAPLKKGMV